jgi:uncharacterized protein (DUF2141 family)
MKTTKIFILLILIFIFINACTKGGTGGSATITGKVLHHEKNIANARVFIKYDEKEFPGSDTTKYDDVVTSDQQANYSFIGLKKGRYYLYAIGKDGVANGNPLDVYGGVRADINSKKETLQFNVPVTEGD